MNLGGRPQSQMSAHKTMEKCNCFSIHFCGIYDGKVIPGQSIINDSTDMLKTSTRFFGGKHRNESSESKNKMKHTYSLHKPPIPSSREVSATKSSFLPEVKMFLQPPSQGLDSKRSTYSKVDSSKSSKGGGSRGASPHDIKMNLAQVGYFSDLVDSSSPMRLPMSNSVQIKGESNSFKKARPKADSVHKKSGVKDVLK